MWDEIGKVAVLLVGIGLCGIGLAAIYFCCIATAEYWRRRKERLRRHHWQRVAYGRGYQDGKAGKPARGKDLFPDR